MKKLNILILFSITSFLVYAQDNVGIGTLTPNSNAILDISTNDKGLLIPRLESNERNNLTSELSTQEIGLLVFDKSDLLFYFWNGSSWISMPNTTVNTDNQDITQAELINNVLTIGIRNGLSASVNLSPLQDGTGTDSQNLIYNQTTSILSIESGNSVDLSMLSIKLSEEEVDDYVANNGYLTTEIDDDVSNELQDLTLTGDIISLSGSSVDIDFVSLS